MSSKLEREKEFDKFFEEELKKKKAPDAELVVGIGIGKGKKRKPEPEQEVEEIEETEQPEENKIDVNTIVDLIKNSNSFDELKENLLKLVEE